MKVLVAKEIRLLLPAGAAALLLAIAPVWLMSRQYNPQASVALYPMCLGALLLAMSTFGREFGLKTFSLMLAQPLERRQIWRVKVAALAAALAMVVAVWSICCVAWLHDWNGQPTWDSVVPLGVMVCIAIFAGGLWTTLLLRQVAAAFWLTALIPAGIAMLIAPDSRWYGWLFYVVLGAYSIGGVLLAWWQFFHAEEVGWTGGNVTLAGWRSGEPAAAEQTATRRRRPLAALLRKELQLNRGGLMGMGAFFVLHVCAMMLRNKEWATETSSVQETLEFVGGLWLLVPLFLVGPGVAEERRLGTLDVQLCQPVSSRLQFTIKLLFSLLVGGLLSAWLLWLAEGIGVVRGVPSGLGEIPLFSGLKQPFDAISLVELSVLFLGLSLAGFLASTLARGTIQAMAAAPAVVIVVLLLAWAVLSGGWQAWATGTMLPVMFWPSVGVALIWCAWRNYRFAVSGWRFWRRNVLALAGALVFAVASAAGIHYRLWECLTPLETAHGPARLPVAGGVKLKPGGADAYGAFTLVLPDGRARADYFWLKYKFAFQPWHSLPPIIIGKRWVGGRGNRFISGSNWVDVVDIRRDVAGIQTDGTLWVSESPMSATDWLSELPKVVQYGEETNWKSITAGPGASAGLQTDGTLWQWGDQATSALVPGEAPKPWPGLRAFEPRRMGTESDWSRLLYCFNWLFAWKNDGTAWVIYGFNRNYPLPQVAITQDVAMERLPVFDNLKFRSLSRDWNSMAGVRQDGSLWVWDFGPQQRGSSLGFALSAPRQAGRGTDWRMAVGYSASLVGLKEDGSLWQFGFGPAKASPTRAEPRFDLENPVQLGSQKDWVALNRDGKALAADGSLWVWADHNEMPWNYGTTALVPSRKPEYIGNIFTENK